LNTSVRGVTLALTLGALFAARGESLEIGHSATLNLAFFTVAMQKDALRIFDKTGNNQRLRDVPMLLLLKHHGRASVSLASLVRAEVSV
jgi:hypothetical protein